MNIRFCRRKYSKLKIRLPCSCKVTNNDTDTN